MTAAPSPASDPATLDLDAYFDRIGYRGAREPTLATLRALHALHTAAIPFENLDPLLGRPVALEIADLHAKLVRDRRGGYCFEQNTLLQGVLEALGFQVAGLASRVTWGQAPDEPLLPRTHMMLRVDLAEGSYVADVGFGGLLGAAPFRLEPDVEQETPAGPVRLAREEDAFVLHARTGSGWASLYRFTLDSHLPVDYVVSNWFTSTHPESLFRGNLLVQRQTSEHSLRLFNRRLTRHDARGGVEEAVLASPADLARALEAEFGLAVSRDEAAALFDRLPAA